jgi:hypothetical protein
MVPGWIPFKMVSDSPPSIQEAAILNGGRSEQKVTTLDNDLTRNISAKYGSNPSSGSWEEVCFTYFPLGRYVNLCPMLAAILDFQSVLGSGELLPSLSVCRLSVNISIFF